jgi:hypothetical protein
MAIVRWGRVEPIVLEDDDFISIPYTPDLSQAGIRRACQRYVLETSPGDEDPLAGLIQNEYQTALELAFQRYLQENNVPFERWASAPLSAPGDTELILGGRRVVLRNFPITGKNQIRRLLHEPDFFLKAWARLPQTHGEVDPRHADDVYVFAFIAALIALQPREFKRALRAQQPVYLVHLLPDTWGRKGNGRSLDNLVLKADCEQEISLELGGRDAQGQFYNEWIRLPPRQRVSTRAEFFSLAYLHAEQLPEGRLGVYSPALDQLHLAGPEGWSNLYVYGMRIVLTGFIPRHEFQRKAYLVTQLEADVEIETEPYLKLPIAQLYSLQALFEHARLWKSSGGMAVQN